MKFIPGDTKRNGKIRVDVVLNKVNHIDEAFAIAKGNPLLRTCPQKLKCSSRCQSVAINLSNKHLKTIIKI